MKKYLYLTASIFLSASLISQHIFPKDTLQTGTFKNNDAIKSISDTTDMDRSTIWYSSSFIGNFADGDCRKKIDIISVIQDTFIDNRWCRLIGVRSDGIYYPESELPVYSKNGKMLFYEDNKWKLLYDFNAKVGDTVTYHVSQKYPYYGRLSVPIPFNQELLNDNPYQLTIEKIDSIYTSSGKPLKRFYTKRIFNFHGHFMDEIIENVGSKEKLFGNNINFIPPQCNPNEQVGLRCYSDDDFSIKFTEGACDKLTAVSDEFLGNIKTYPNPGQDLLQMNLNDGVALPITYQVVDISGRKYLTDTQYQSDFTIATGFLSAGIYIITIQDKAGKIWYSKWVKQ